MFSDLKYYYWYCKYFLSFSRWLWNHHWLSGTIIIRKYLMKMSRKKFVYFIKNKYDDRFPFFYNIHWAFKYSCDLEIDAFEYTYFTNYINSIKFGNRPVPYWMINERPTEKHMPGLIPCGAAINERKKDLQHEILILRCFNKPTDNRDDNIKNQQCDMHDWIIDNCAGEWYFDSYGLVVNVFFTHSEDAMAFKLAWA